MGEPNWPFVGTAALAAGDVSRRTLRSRHTMVYRNVYLQNGRQLAAVTRAVAAWLRSGRQATAAGLSAAALHGSAWIDSCRPAELIRGGIPVTTPARTAFDLGRRKGLAAAVIRLDALAHATDLKPVDVELPAERHRGARGLVQLRRALDLMDGGAESPQETRTRLLPVNSGLRKPRTQIVVCGEFGYPFARVDMGWEDCLVGVEFDGAQHGTDPAQRTRDIDRYAELAARGWRMVRVSSDLLRYRPGVVVARTYSALQEAGCGWLAECGLDGRLLRGAVS